MQNYVASELTHFVGRSQTNDSGRYELLLRIFRCGLLLDPQYLNRDTTPIVFFDMKTKSGAVRQLNYHPRPKFEVRPHRSVDTNEFVAPEIVCFCDIPADQLHIHTAKYSKFGLAFSKEFLISRGANPVWYVARDAITPMELVSTGRFGDFFAGEFDSSSRGEFLERMKQRILEIDERERQRLQAKLSTYARGKDDPQALRQELMSQTDFAIGLFAYVFGYVKIFNPSLADDDPDNYYMEREWRVIGKVPFRTSDVRRVFVPSELVESFRADAPDFRGEVLGL